MTEWLGWKQRPAVAQRLPHRRDGIRDVLRETPAVGVAEDQPGKEGKQRPSRAGWMDTNNNNNKGGKQRGEWNGMVCQQGDFNQKDREASPIYG